MEATMMGKRLLALVAATGVFGLSPVYAFEDSDELSFEIKPYTEQVAAIEDDESLDLTYMAALDDAADDEGVAGRAGVDGSEGLEGTSSVESSGGHWAVETPSAGSLISD
jgi:hypothetical protein